MKTDGSRRWLIAALGALLQLCLGTVYAWSYFQNPLVHTYAWSHTQVAWVFSLTIFSLGLVAAWGGRQLPRFGPRILAVGGGLLFGLGYLVAARGLQMRSLPLLYLGYGVIGGTGLGLGYVTPVATVAKWFPDKKGLATGMVVMGFGFGALLMSKVIAPWLMRTLHNDLVQVFTWLGIGFAVVTGAVGAGLRNPPSASPTAGGPTREPAGEPEELPWHKLLLSRQFALMWLVFFCNITAGIAIITFQSPLFQDLWHRLATGVSPEALAARGATLIAVSSLFNGVGRFFWGGLSDRLGRLRTFQVMLATQLAAFGVLILTGHPWLFGALVCYVLLCYGGGFGTMPAFVLDTFGSRRMAVVYGLMLTAWSVAGVVGPQIFAVLKDCYGDRAGPRAFGEGALFLAVGLLLSLALARLPERRA